MPAGSRFSAVVLGQSRALCCPGCQAVAETIVQGGLEHYYSHRSEAANNPQQLPQALPTSWPFMTAATCSSPSSNKAANGAKPAC